MKLNSMSFFKFGVGIMLAIQLSLNATAQIVPIGSGSYTKTFPGVDAANRNSFPSGTPYVSGIAATKPIPTNDWWSLKLKNPHVNNMFNYPMALGSVNSGMVVSYINAPSGAGGSSQPMDDVLPVIVGVKDLNATEATVYDYSDFTVSLNWTNGTHNFNATTGIAMPFIYFTKSDADIAQIRVNEGTVTISAEILIIENAHHGADFAVFAPVGSVWEQNGKVYTSTLNSKNYWSVAHLPSTASSLASAANEYKKYAYVFPTNTVTNWEYNENTGIVRTTFSAICDVKEGTETEMLLGLLPHQWGNLATNSPMPG
jgi:endoglucanase Acf2